MYVAHNVLFKEVTQQMTHIKKYLAKEHLGNHATSKDLSELLSDGENGEENKKYEKVKQNKDNKPKKLHNPKRETRKTVKFTNDDDDDTPFVVRQRKFKEKQGNETKMLRNISISTGDKRKRKIVHANQRNKRQKTK